MLARTRSPLKFCPKNLRTVSPNWSQGRKKEIVIYKPKYCKFAIWFECVVNSMTAKVPNPQTLRYQIHLVTTPHFRHSYIWVRWFYQSTNVSRPTLTGAVDNSDGELEGRDWDEDSLKETRVSDEDEDQVNVNVELNHDDTIDASTPCFLKWRRKTLWKNASRPATRLRLT